MKFMIPHESFAAAPGREDEKPGDNTQIYRYFIIKAFGVPWCLGALVPWCLGALVAIFIAGFNLNTPAIYA
ncbi:MAG: hypothetical protein MUF15_09725 [Acidobacteria bacterium]|jgi:hypothetical protein|nr:hypothetical protein [Acidobacteriota bacterium]